jgi:hypothetical protein
MKIIKISRTFRNENLSKTIKNYSELYYQQARSNRRKSIRDGEQD